MQFYHLFGLLFTPIIIYADISAAVTTDASLFDFLQHFFAAFPSSCLLHTCFMLAFRVLRFTFALYPSVQQEKRLLRKSGCPRLIEKSGSASRNLRDHAANLNADVWLQLLQSLLSDAADVRQIIHRFKASVSLTVLDNSRSHGRTDAVKCLKLL